MFTLSHLQTGCAWPTHLLHSKASMFQLRERATITSSATVIAVPLHLTNVPNSSSSSSCNSSSSSSLSMVTSATATTDGMDSRSTSARSSAGTGLLQHRIDTGSAAQPSEQPSTWTATCAAGYASFDGMRSRDSGVTGIAHTTTAATSTASSSSNDSDCSSTSSGVSSHHSNCSDSSGIPGAGVGGGGLAKASIHARLQQARSRIAARKGPGTCSQPASPPGISAVPRHPTRSVRPRSCHLQEAAQPLAPQLHALLPRQGHPVTAADSVAFAEAAAGHYQLPPPLAALVVTAVMQRRLRSFVPLCSYIEAMQRLVKVYGVRPVAAWVRRAPVIVRHEDQVGPRLALLGSLSGLAPKAVVALTQRCPPLLAVEGQLLEPRLEALCAVLGRPRDQGPDLLRAAPAALALRPAMLRYKASMLAAAAASHPRWAVWWATASPTSVAVAVTYSRQRLLRLDYVRALGAQGSGACIQVAVQETDAAFVALYPGYQKWARLWGPPLLQLEEALGLAPRRATAAAAAVQHPPAVQCAAEELAQYRQRAAAAACAAHWLDGGIQVPGPGDAAAWGALEAAAAHIQQHLGDLHAPENADQLDAWGRTDLHAHSMYSSQQWQRIHRLLQEQQPPPIPPAVLCDALTAAPAAAFTAEHTRVLYLVAALAAAAAQPAGLRQQQQHLRLGQPQAIVAAGASEKSFRDRITQQRLQAAAAL